MGGSRGARACHHRPGRLCRQRHDSQRIEGDTSRVTAGRTPVRQGLSGTLPSSAGPAGASPSSFFGWGSSYGNGKLWVGGLWPAGVIDAGPEFLQKDGSISMKFGWWRAVAGDLQIQGRRLDAAAPPLHGDVPSGYGETGHLVEALTAAGLRNPAVTVRVVGRLERHPDSGKLKRFVPLPIGSTERESNRRG